MESLEELSARINKLESNFKDQKRKTWVEIVAIPIAIAVTGLISASLVTRAQIANSESISSASVTNAAQIARANLEAAERTATSQKQLKALELHVKYIADPDPRIRELGVKMLSAIEPDLANRLRELIIASENNPAVKASAEQIEIAGWFAIIASSQNIEEAKKFAHELNERKIPYNAQVFTFTDDTGNIFYAITLDGYLSQSEAKIRVAYARKNGIARDAFSALRSGRRSFVY